MTCVCVCVAGGGVRATILRITLLVHILVSVYKCIKCVVASINVDALARVMVYYFDTKLVNMKYARSRSPAISHAHIYVARSALVPENCAHYKTFIWLIRSNGYVAAARTLVKHRARTHTQTMSRQTLAITRSCKFVELLVRLRLLLYYYYGARLLIAIHQAPNKIERAMLESSSIVACIEHSALGMVLGWLPARIAHFSWANKECLGLIRNDLSRHLQAFFLHRFFYEKNLP